MREVIASVLGLKEIQDTEQSSFKHTIQVNKANRVIQNANKTPAKMLMKETRSPIAQILFA